MQMTPSGLPNQPQEHLVRIDKEGNSRRRVWASQWFFVLYLIAASLFCTEVALRVEGWVQRRAHQDKHQGWETIWEYSPELHHRLLPNGIIRHQSFEYDYVWANNSLGMRDRERSRPKDPNRFRILFLGDSFVQGHSAPLDDTITSILELTLNSPKREKTIEVWNAGVFAYSPMLESLYLRQLIGNVAPDLVLDGFTLENDVSDDYFYTHVAHYSASGAFSHFDDHLWPWSKIVEALDNQEAPRTVDKTSVIINGLSSFLTEHVLNHSRIFEVLKGWRAHLQRDRDYLSRREREFALNRERRADISYNPALINFPVLTREQRLEYWKTSEKFLSNMVAMCRSRGIPFVLVVIPPYQRLSGETSFGEPYQILDEFGRKSSAPVIQLLPDFLMRKPDDLYFKYDRHWTQEGNRLAAAVVDRELRSLQLLPVEVKP